jgi:hypothetical protein
MLARILATQANVRMAEDFESRLEKVEGQVRSEEALQ